MSFLFNGETMHLMNFNTMQNNTVALQKNMKKRRLIEFEWILCFISTIAMHSLHTSNDQKYYAHLVFHLMWYFLCYEKPNTIWIPDVNTNTFGIFSSCMWIVEQYQMQRHSYSYMQRESVVHFISISCG